MNWAPLAHQLDPDAGLIEGVDTTPRHLDELEDAFVDLSAWREAVASGNPIVYTVATVAGPDGSGALNYGLGVVKPGRVGREYFQTRGHYHTWREAAEIYVGLRGEGCLLMEDERTGESGLVNLHPNSAVQVPGFTAHRTVNTGTVPLVYLGIYPAQAGHDYATLAGRPFRKIVIEHQGRPELADRP
jgi:glucose-6-phosphate isomerase, archaeal